MLYGCMYKMDYHRDYGHFRVIELERIDRKSIALPRLASCVCVNIIRKMYATHVTRTLQLNGFLHKNTYPKITLWLQYIPAMENHRRGK